jgi:hypothetical protein
LTRCHVLFGCYSPSFDIMGSHHEDEPDIML